MSTIFNRSGGFKTFYKTSPVTTVIIALNTVMLLVTIVTGGFNTINLNSLGAIKAVFIDQGEWYRLFSSAFLHGDVLHFLSNTVIGLIVLSSGLERIIKSKKFFIIYFSSLVLSALTVYFYNSLIGPDITTIGASGAIFGSLGSLLYITIYRKDLLTDRDMQSIRMLVIIYIIFSFLSPGISIAAHVGGLLAGFVVSFLLIRRNVFKVLH